MRKNPLGFKLIVFGVACLTLVISVSCRKDSVSTTPDLPALTIRLRHLSMGKKLMQAAAVQDSSGATLSLSKFQYYLSGIRLETENPMDTYREADSFHLIKALENGGETLLSLPGVDFRAYKTLLVQIGLDSITNQKTGGTGALDPGNGMYWPWSSEYKFMVLEGSFQYPDTSGAFLFHIAGNACFRTIRIPLQEGGNSVSIGGGSEIILDVNLASLLGAPHPVDFRKMNNVMSAESGARKLADNYEAGNFFRLAGLR